MRTQTKPGFVSIESIVCPHCGHIISIDENFIFLEADTLHVWLSAGVRFWYGSLMTLDEIAARSNYSKATVRRHLKRLEKVGLVEAIPTKPGSRYHKYRGKFHNNGTS